MSSFSGFSEADIRKLQNGEQINSYKISDAITAVTGHKKATMVTKQKYKQNIKKQKVPESKLTDTQQLEDIPDEAKLNMNNSNNESTIATPTIDKIPTDVHDNQNESTCVNTIGVQSEKKCIDLEEFQTKQRHMEEQNRLRKEQVAKALEDRTKRSLEEQQKLVEIQSEFKKLDATLSDDVKILRKEIETASYEYMEAQKKYNKVEKEFLDAKLYLHQKLEKKDMLTEHLCAIIEKNEERKAEKLNELLQKLEVLDDVNVKEVQDNEITTNH